MDVALEGAFEPVYADGDNTSCLTTDTMKNTVYAFARQDPIDHVEAFASRLAEHFAAKPGVTLARIEAVEHPWTRLSADGQPHPHAFAQPGGEEWTRVVTRDAAAGRRSNPACASLVVLKTTDSAFCGFPARPVHDAARDARSHAGDVDHGGVAVRAGLRRLTAHATPSAAALVETFAGHKSESVQHTLYAMGEAALAACDGIAEITISLPNRHYLLVDLTPFGLDNPNEVFVATDQPFGLIEGSPQPAAARRPAMIFTNDRPRSSAADRPLGVDRFALGDRAAVHRPQEVVQQSLPGRRIVEHVADERGLRRLLRRSSSAAPTRRPALRGRTRRPRHSAYGSCAGCRSQP